MALATAAAPARSDVGGKSHNAAAVTAIKSNASTPHLPRECQNFDDIQDRLITMQGELSSLTAMFKESNIGERRKLDVEGESASVDRVPNNFDDKVPLTTPPTTPGHVVRDGDTLIERYHGPWTPVALCRDFAADLSSHVGNHVEVVGGLLNKMLLDTGTDNSLDFGSRLGQQDTICLPPRQFLSVMLDSFLKQADYATDIFSRESVYEAVERVYKDPSSPTSEPWALCFNLIILLTLGAEHPVHSDDPFVRPILQAAHVAARKPSFFMSQRLVNVQALALLSLLAQQYHNETLGDSMFAQACMLAKTTGLQQAGYGFAPSNLSAGETDERLKVFRSLYIRDRYSTTASGALSWLPNDYSEGRPATTSATQAQGALSSQPHAHAPHWELAKMQDQFHGLLCPTSTIEVSTAERPIALARLQQKLKAWSQTHKIPSSTRPSTVDEVSLHLSFLGTRIRALNTDSSSDGACPIPAQVLYDARLSCLLVATSCYHHLNEALTERLDRLLSTSAFTSPEVRPQSSSASSPSSITDPMQRTAPLTPASSSLGQAPISAPLPLHRLTSVFPTAALFVLAKHILGIGSGGTKSPSTSPASQNDEGQQEINEDISLLEALLLCFRNAPPPTSTRGRMDAYGTRVGRITQHLVDIIRAIVGPTDTSLADATGDGDVYTSEPLLAQTSPMLLDASSNAMGLPNLNLYNSGVSPFNLGLAPPSSRSSWTLPTDSVWSSAASMANTNNSSNTSSIAPTPTIPDTPFDISQFLNQMGTSSPAMWDGSQGQADVQLQQQAQSVPERTTTRWRKRPRTEGSRDQDEDTHYRSGVS
ncbi:MAG: hypothetical protein Q9157_001155 [Trypethelium eluteriae]